MPVVTWTKLNSANAQLSSPLAKEQYWGQIFRFLSRYYRTTRLLSRYCRRCKQYVTSDIARIVQHVVIQMGHFLTQYGPL